VWAYRVVIVNEGATPLRLRRRHWKITDGNGHMQEVEGEGVVGEQPLLTPHGGKFEYTSGCPLNTPDGIMVGTYSMEAPDGRTSLVDIPAFSLDSPERRVSLN
jgi:ApaG protein